MTTYAILGASGNVITTFANSQIVNGFPPILPTGQTYSEIAVSGGLVGQVWNGTAFVAGPIAPTTIMANALASGITIISTGTPTLNGVYSVDQQAQDNAAGVASGIGSGQGLPGGGSTMVYLDSTGAPHTYTPAQFLTLADAIRNYVYQLDITAAQAAAGQAVTWPIASATIP